MGPLEFIPILKRIRWGGRRLGELLGKPIGSDPDYAESWELCDLGRDQSIVARGPYAGWPLTRLIQERGSELLGRHAPLAQFPLLVKFLDAHDRLSLQVHPDDIQAGIDSTDHRGKTEAWVVLEADPGSCLYAGLQTNVDAIALCGALDSGTIERCLHRVDVAAGDCLLIPAGTVHAIGEGILLAEVQQTSDLTYRLFDWNRLGSDGRPRPLQIEQALRCIDFSRGPVDKVTPVRMADAAHHLEVLVQCPYFTIRRHTLGDSDLATISDDGRCHILIGLAGSLHCTGIIGESRIGVGTTLLVPASALPVNLESKARAVFLEVFWD